MPQNDSRKRFKKKAPKRPRPIETSPEDDALADLAKYGPKFDELLENQPDWFASSVKLDEEGDDAVIDTQLDDPEFNEHVSKWLSLKKKHGFFFFFFSCSEHDILFFFLQIRGRHRRTKTYGRTSLKRRILADPSPGSPFLLSRSRTCWSIAGWVRQLRRRTVTAKSRDRTSSTSTNAS